MTEPGQRETSLAVADLDAGDSLKARIQALFAEAQLDTPEDTAWVLWLPGGTRLLAGALNYSYAVDAVTYSARPFFFFPGNPDHDIMDTPDVNFSVTLVAGSG